MEDTDSNAPFSRRFIVAAVGTAVIIALGAAAIVTDGAGALEDGKLDDGQHLLSETEISPDQAIEIAQRDVSGSVDDVDLFRTGGELVYEIEIDDTDVHVDAQTGDILYVEHDNDDDFTSREQIASSDASSDARTVQTDITVDQAVEIALGEVDGRVEGVELDHEGGRLVYEVEIDDTDVYVDATDGTVLHVDHDDDDDSADAYSGSGNLSSTPEISIDEASAIAQSEVDGQIEDIELDREDGRLVYEVEIGEHEVYVDASDGAVLKVEMDD